MSQRIELESAIQRIEVDAITQKVEVKAVTDTISVLTIGQRGPQGIQGPQGEVGPQGDPGVSLNGLLGYVSYAPATDSLIAATTSTSFSDVSAANLVVTFTAPSSGIVLVRFSLMVYSGASTDYFVNLRDSGGNVADTSMRPCAGEQLGATFRSFSLIKAGLTPGQTYTWKLGHRRVGPNNVGIYGGPNFGANVIEVWRV